MNVGVFKGFYLEKEQGQETVFTAMMLKCYVIYLRYKQPEFFDMLHTSAAQTYYVEKCM